MAALLTLSLGVAPLVAAPASAAAVRPAVAAPADAAQTVSFDQQMINLINQARQSNGLSNLVEARGLTSVAMYWSNQLNAGATGYQLAHNPNAWTQVATSGASNRRAWGENVAWSSSTGSSAQDIFTAYMNSPGHRANILSPTYHFVGMGTVGGAHGLWNTTEFTDAVQPGQAVTATPAAPTTPTPPAVKPPVMVEGSFVRDTVTRVTYRIVGGAPLVVTSWTPYGTTQPFTFLTTAQLRALRTYPADGTYIRDSRTHATYVVAGGMPLFVSNWPSVGGMHPFLIVDTAVIAKVGGTGDFSHLRSLPLDETYLRGGHDTYRVLGGVARRIPNWAVVGGQKPFTIVDPKLFSNTAATTLTSVHVEGPLHG